MIISRLEKHRKLPILVRDTLFNYLPLINDKRYNLNISESHQFIWFRVPKVGTRTILHEFDANNVQFTTTPIRVLNYRSPKYASYYSFAFVRNPWDRIVSCWFNKVVDHNRFGFPETVYEDMLEFGNFVNYLESINMEKTDRHVRPQHLSIDLQRVNFIGRFENFTADLQEVMRTLGLNAGSKKLAKMNSSNREHSDYRQYYNAKAKKTIAQLYADDIEHFKYTF